MKVLPRGYSDFVEVTDQLIPVATGSTPIARDAGVTAGTQGPSDHGTPDLGIVRIDAVTFPTMLTGSDGAPHSEGPAQPAPVASAVTSVPAVGRGGVAGSDGGGDGEIGRDSDGLASLALNGPDYADHGWLIVPSASNEYGESAYAAAGDFAFDMAAGEFSADWFMA